MNDPSSGGRPRSGTKLEPFDADRAYAERLDDEDPLKAYRDRFVRPEGDPLYFCGNSLGLMPKDVPTLVQEELDAWGRLAVDGHFEGPRPWYGYHEQFTDLAARLVGAKPGEVVVMNSLTVNMHLLMISFYRPTAERYRIVIEDSAFPSDRYAVQAQASLHGFDPDDAVVVMKPREGEHLLRTEDIEAYLEREGQSVSTVMLGGVNFYTGQAYDLRRLAAAAHAAGASFGTDLAHAAGNLELKLHDDDVDYAGFCTYKYLNAGPGSVAGAYVHERHADRPELVRLAGWWGNDPEVRFQMPEQFVPQSGAAGWQISNAPVLSMAALLASLRIFDEVGMAAIRQKSVALTGYLERWVDHLGGIDLISPRDPEARGAQLSLRIRSFAGAGPEGTKAFRDLLQKRGVVTDFRPPDVIRVAPAPLYNRFVDVWMLAQVLKEALGADG